MVVVISMDDSKTTTGGGSRTKLQSFNEIDAIDALCMCREFKTPKTGWKQKHDNNDECTSLGFRKRWIQWTSQEFPSWRNQFLESNEIAVGYGLFAILFASTDGQRRITVAFRHQEGDQLWDHDMLEAMGLWGRNKVQQDLGSDLAGPNTLVSTMAYTLQVLIHRVRKSLGMDYLTQSDKLVEELVRSFGTKTEIRFVGYSLGGAIAQLQALQYPEETTAILFASVGVQDIARRLYPERFENLDAIGSSRIVNIFQESDTIPKMDCQYGTLCPFGSNTMDAQAAHEELVYGSMGLEFLLGFRRYETEWKEICMPATAFNRLHAVCSSNHGIDPEPLSSLQLTIFLSILFVLWGIDYNRRMQR